MILFLEIKTPLTIRIKRFLIVRQTLSIAYVNYDILVNVDQYVYQIVIFLKLYCELICTWNSTFYLENYIRICHPLCDYPHILLLTYKCSKRIINITP